MSWRRLLVVGYTLAIESALTEGWPDAVAGIDAAANRSAETDTETAKIEAARERYLLARAERGIGAA